MLSIGLVKRSSDAVKYYEKDDYYTREQPEKESARDDLLALAEGEGHQTSRDAGDTADGAGSSSQGTESVGSAPSGGGGGSGTGTGGSDPRDKDGDRSGESRGEWGGDGAKALGLEGTVRREDFQSILDGHLPNGVVLGRKFEGEWQHTPGWDLTFSAPKSISILAEVGQDERLHQAHATAVKEALAWTEENAVGARIHSEAGTVFTRTDSMVVAQFTHHTSRNQDPNLHTHAVVANVTQTDDGQWRSVHSHEPFKNKMAIGQIYRSALAREVLELGYSIEQTHRDGRFEVVGVPDELVKAMSTRRAQVESKLAQWGASSPEAAATAALVTRARKEDTPLSLLIDRWRSAVAARGFDIDRVVDDAKARGPQEMHSGIPFEGALRESIGRLSEPEAVFRHGDLVREVLQRTLGRADVAKAEELINTARDGAPIRAVDEGGIRLWTTTRAGSQERRSLEIAAGVDRTAQPYFSPEKAESVLAEKGLTAGQANAAKMILTTDSPHLGVLGRPGTGKTTMLKTVGEELKRQGVHVVGLAQNADAARNLQKEAGFESSTIHKHLRRIAPELARASKTGFFDRLLTTLSRKDEVWVVDESSQLSNKLLSHLLHAADKLGARTVFVGDTRQLAAIEAGKPFELLLDRGMPYVEMHEILRQRNPGDREIVHDAIAGRNNEALKKLESRTTEITDREDRQKAIVDEWAKDPSKRKETLVLTLTNEERRELNEQMRDVLRNEGALHGEVGRTVLEKVWGYRADGLDASFYKTGYVVQFTAGQDAHNIEAGSYLRVAAVDPKLNTVTLWDEKRQTAVVWNPREDGNREKFPTIVYERKPTTLAPGETVRWARNDESLKLVNGDLVTAKDVRHNSTTFVDGAGRTIKVSHDRDSGQHWSHAYASTVYGSQGRTADRVLINLDERAGHLMTQKAFVVAVSRHRDDIKLYTSSTESVRDALDRNVGDKSSAIDAHERNREVETALEREKLVIRLKDEHIRLRDAVAKDDVKTKASTSRSQEKSRSNSRSKDTDGRPGRDDKPRSPPTLER